MKDNQIKSIGWQTAEKLTEHTIIYGILKRISTMGTSRTFDLYYVEKGKIRRLCIPEIKRNKRNRRDYDGYYRVDGCGFNQLQDLVNSISYYTHNKNIAYFNYEPL